MLRDRRAKNFKEGKSFVDVTASSGTGELHKGHGIAFADLDKDGDEDIVAEIGGATPGVSHALRLFENPGHGNDWISLKLVGVKTNRAAIGARIKVTVENEGRGTRSIYRSVGSGGAFGASPLEQHIGLGKSARIGDIREFPNEGLMDHSLHTALIDRQGRLLANIEGNQFTAAQLGDLTETALRLLDVSAGRRFGTPRGRRGSPEMSACGPPAASRP